MAHRVVWSGRALRDVEDIANFISQDSPAYASAVVKTILNHTKMLDQFPRSGRIVPEIGNENIREVIAYSYRIIYSITNDNVLIAAVIHGRRMLQ